MSINRSFKRLSYARAMQEVAEKPAETTASSERLQVREANSDKQRRAVLEFRDLVMIDELGINPIETDDAYLQDQSNRDDTARHLYLVSEGSIAGCLRFYNAAMIPPSEEMNFTYGLDAFADFNPAFLSFTDHMVVGARWRGSQAPALLTAAAFKLARSAGAHFDFTYCPPALVGLYEKIGYRRYSSEYLEGEAGLRVPMILVMDDVQHLRAINSPFAPLALLKEPDPSMVRWFQSTFPEAANRSVKALRDEQNLWEYLTRQLHQNPLHGVPLFEGLNYDDARRFLRKATTLVLHEGDRLARFGDVSDEAYVMLSGRMEIRDRHGVILAQFGKGAVAGEIAYLAATPRTADMVITQDAEVLVLSQETFHNTMQKEPAVVSKILFNLTLILAERLKVTSEQLSAQDRGVRLQS